MIIYNITYIIEQTKAQTWLQWVHKQFENSHFNSPFLKGFRWIKVLDATNEGSTICLQLYFEDTEDLQQFLQLHSAQMDSEIWEKFAHLFVSYKTTMQEIVF